MKKENFIEKYTIGDFFNKTANMVKLIIKDASIISLIAFFPVAILYGITFKIFFNNISYIINLLTNKETIESGKFLLNLVISRLLFPYILLFLLSLSYSLIAGFVYAFVSNKVFLMSKNENIGMMDNLKITFKENFPKIILQFLIILFIYYVFILVLGIITILFSVLAGILSKISVFFTIIFVLLIILAFLFFTVMIVWLGVNLYFSMYAIVSEKLGPINGIKKSFALVKNNWWRVFGISLLIGLIMNFAINIAIGPVIFVLILPYYIEMLKGILSGDLANYMENIGNLYKYLSNISYVLGFVVWIKGIIYSIIYPVYFSLFYIDLKVRKNEIPLQAQGSEEKRNEET